MSCCHNQLTQTGYINTSELSDTKLWQKEIELEVKEWLDEARDRTKKLIAKHWDKLKKLAKLLQDKEIVTEEELLKLMK